MFLMFFFIMLIMSSLVSISSNSLLGVWMGLEINTISFIPLLMNKSDTNSLESMLIYFLFQTLASSLLFFMLLSSLMFPFNFLLKKILILPILMKLGAAPFHMWFILIMENLSWEISLILMIWQKLAPMIILSYMNMKFIKIFIILSVIIGAIGGFNQISLRKIIAFSSINHLGWMLASLLMTSLVWKIYFMIYSFLICSMIMILNNLNYNFLFQMFFFTKENLMKMLFIFFNIFSMAGLPPFLGFFPKLIVAQSLIILYSITLLMIMLMSSLIIFYYYFHIINPMTLLDLAKTKYYNKNINKMKLIFIFTLINFMGSPLMFLILKFIN